MKKSQMSVAAALALTLGTVSPLANVYAEAIQTGCEPSADANTLDTISGQEIDGILGRIQKLDLYQVYNNAKIVRAKYYGGPAAAIDQAVLDAETAQTAADGVVTAAQTTVDGISLSDIATKIRQLSKADYTLAADATAESVMQDVHTKLMNYDKYVELIQAFNSRDLLAMQTLAAEIAAVDTDFANEVDVTVVAAAATANDARTEINQSIYKKYRSIYTEEQKVIALAEAKAEAEQAAAGVDNAKQAQTAAIDEIVKALTDLDAFDEVTVGTVWARSTADAMVRFIKDSNISGYDNWMSFISYVESTHGYSDATQNVDLYTDIETELRKVVSDESTIDTVFNPVVERKVCSTDGNVAIKGNLPASKLVVKAELIDDLTDSAFADFEQDVYDITIEYKGATYDNDKLQAHNPEGVTVVVDVPETMDGAKATVYYVEGNNRKIQSSSYDAENGTISFTAGHFSHYAVVAPQKTAEPAPVDPAYVYQTLTNSNYGVTVEGYFKANTEYKVNVTLLEDSFAYSDDEEINTILANNTNQVFYQIEVVEIIDGEEVAYDLNGQAVTVYLTLPNGMDGNFTLLFRENTETTKLSYVDNAEYNEYTNTFRFTTEQLGIYALIEIVEDQPDDSFGGFDNDSQFTVDAPIITPAAKPSVEAPNTGVAAQANTGNGASASATAGLVANLLAIAGAGVAMIIRRIRRQA